MAETTNYLPGLLYYKHNIGIENINHYRQLQNTIDTSDEVHHFIPGTEIATRRNAKQWHCVIPPPRLFKGIILLSDSLVVN